MLHSIPWKRESGHHHVPAWADAPPPECPSWRLCIYLWKIIMMNIFFLFLFFQLTLHFFFTTLHHHHHHHLCIIAVCHNMGDLYAIIHCSQTSISLSAVLFIGCSPCAIWDMPIAFWKQFLIQHSVCPKHSHPAIM